jgi:hypothetical protein
MQFEHLGARRSHFTRRVRQDSHDRMGRLRVNRRVGLFGAIMPFEIAALRSEQDEMPMVPENVFFTSVIVFLGDAEMFLGEVCLEFGSRAREWR